MIIIRNAAVALEARPWLETLPASGLRSGTFRPTRSSCSEVVPQPLRPGLANVELRADRADRRNAMRCQLIGEYLGCLFTERVQVIRTSGYAARCRLRTADNHHEQFIGADQRDRRPRGHRSTDRPVPQPVGHVGRERRRDAQAEKPPRQRRLHR